MSRAQYESVPTDGHYAHGHGGQGGQGGGYLGQVGASMANAFGGGGQYDTSGMNVEQGHGYQGDDPQRRTSMNGPAASGTLKNMQTTHGLNIVCFAASCGIMLGAFLSGFKFVFDFSVVDWLNMNFILLFGLVMAVIDTPFFKSIKMVVQAKEAIGKYINILTRVTGKGIAFVFLGCSLFSALFSNGDLPSGFMQFLAFMNYLFVVVVGIMCITIGTMKSHKLQKAQTRLNGILEKKFPEYAKVYRGDPRHDFEGGGLTPEEFNFLSADSTSMKWEDADLRLIFNALNSNPSWRAPDGGVRNGDPMIPFADLKAWVYGGLVWL